MSIRFSPDLRFETKAISNFTIGITENCNMRCKYCCYSGSYPGLRSHSKANMPDATISKALEFIKSHAHPSDHISVSFYGGEALLRLDDIERIVEDLSAHFGARVSFDISTNGLFLAESAIERICRLPATGVSVSLDACRLIHDRRRLRIDGSVTFNQIVANLLRFRERFPEEYRKRIRLMVTFENLDEIEEANPYFSKFTALLGEKKAHISRVMPNFEQKSYLPDRMDQKRRALSEALRKRRAGITDFHSLWLEDLERKVRKRFTPEGASPRILIHTCLNSLYSVYLTADGKIYPCEKFGTDHCIGNLDTGIDERLLRKTAIAYALRRKILCSDCEAAEYCGRCPADLKLSFSDMKNLCEDYKNDIRLKHEAGL